MSNIKQRRKASNKKIIKDIKSSQKKEIIWNIINSLLAGGLVLLGSFSTGNINSQGFILAFIAASIIAVSRFKEYWAQEEQEYKCYTINFI